MLGSWLSVNSLPILFWGAVVLIGIAVFMIAHVIFTEESQYKASETLEDADAKVSGKETGIVLKYSRPFFRRYISPVVAGMKGKQKIRKKYKRKLANAGLIDELTPDDLFSFKLFLIIGFPFVYMALRIFMMNEGEEPWPLSYVPFISIFGYFYPDIWLNGRITKRRKEVAVVMPFIVDMLAMAVEAGLDTVNAIGRVIDKAPPSALRDEFEILVKEIKVGASRAEALRNLSWRVNLIQVSSFCATLIAADSVGASIGPILKSLAAEMRQKRSALLEKAAAKAASLIMVPTIFIIVPAVIIIIFAPMLLGTFSGSN